MILPSDGDTDPSGEEKKPGGKPGDKTPGKKPEPNPGKDSWIHPDLGELPDMSDLSDILGFDDSDADEESPYLPKQEGNWREVLYNELRTSLKLLAEIPEPLEDFDPPDPPDLFTFYQELAALKQALRESQNVSPQIARLAEKMSTAMSKASEGQMLAELKLRIALLAADAETAGQPELAARMRALANPDA